MEAIAYNNLQKLMIEIFKSMNRVNPTLVWEFHERKHVTYNLRKKSLCKLPPVKTMNISLDLISFWGSLCRTPPEESMKREQTLVCFQKRIGK